MNALVEALGFSPITSPRPHGTGVKRPSSVAATGGVLNAEPGHWKKQKLMHAPISASAFHASAHASKVPPRTLAKPTRLQVPAAAMASRTALPRPTSARRHGLTPRSARAAAYDRAILAASPRKPVVAAPMTPGSSAAVAVMSALATARAQQKQLSTQHVPRAPVGLPISATPSTLATPMARVAAAATPATPATPAMPKSSSSTGEFVCAVAGCSKSFIRRDDLGRHRIAHIDRSQSIGGGKDKPYQCTQPGCGKSYTRKAHLIHHMYIHEGLKPFRCSLETCDAAFVRPSDLRRHMRTHTGEKRYTCPVQGCGMSFTRRDNLTYHATRKHGGASATVSRSNSGSQVGQASTAAAAAAAVPAAAAMILRPVAQRPAYDTSTGAAPAVRITITAPSAQPASMSSVSLAAASSAFSPDVAQRSLVEHDAAAAAAAAAAQASESAGLPVDA